MYGKLFESIYDGTLVEDWQALITFQQMIILCDSDGTLDMTPSAISRRTGIPINHIKYGIEILEKPDPESRTPNENGKRIKRIDEHRDWGWVIINHKKYRDLKTSADRREYMRRYMREKRKAELTKTNKSLPVNNVIHTDANADTNTNTQDQKKRASPFVPPTEDDVFEYCQQRNNKVDPESFIDHYEANGWMRGKTKIKDWKACVRTWEKRNGSSGQRQNTGFDQRSRAQKVSDKLDEIARRDIEQNGFTDKLG